MSEKSGTDEATFRSIYELRRGNFTRTVEAAKEALQENPQNFWAAFSACVAFGYLDERLDVVQYIKILENIEEHSPYLAYLQAYVALWLSDTEKALWYWTRLLDIPQGWLAKELISQSRDFEKLIKKAQAGDISDFIILPDFFSSLDFSYENTSGMQMNFTEANLEENDFSLEEFLSQMLTAYTSEVLELAEQNETELEQQNHFAEQLTEDVNDYFESSSNSEKEKSKDIILESDIEENEEIVEASLKPSAKTQKHLDQFKKEKMKKEQEIFEKDREALQALQNDNFEQTSEEPSLKKLEKDHDQKTKQELKKEHASSVVTPLEETGLQKEEALAYPKKDVGTKEEVSSFTNTNSPQENSQAEMEKESLAEKDIPPFDEKDISKEKTLVIATSEDYEILESNLHENPLEEKGSKKEAWLAAEKKKIPQQSYQREKKDDWFEPPQATLKRRYPKIDKRFLYFFSLSTFFILLLSLLVIFEKPLRTQLNNIFTEKENTLEWHKLKINEWANVVSQSKDSQYSYKDRQQLIDDFEMAKKIIGEGKVNQARFLLQRIILSNADFKSKEKSKIFLNFIPNVSYQDFHDPIALKNISKYSNFYFDSIVLIEGKIFKEVDGDNGKILSALVNEDKEKYLVDAFLPTAKREKNWLPYQEYHKKQENNKEKMAILFGKFKGLIGQPPRIYLELEKIWY